MENQRSTKSMDEWELSKENVQPLKQGRKMMNLTAALQPQNVDRQQQLILQRQGFETELRAYSGDDPIDPWVRYIQWTEQNFPQGGKDSHLGILMQKCLIQFKNNEQYKQDQRYVSIWLKMAQYDSESMEIFKFMQANGLGTQLTMFYEAWAWELEQAGNTKKADAIYQEGLTCNAQPRDRLERAMVEFQSRVGRATMQQLQDGMMKPAPTSEDQRATLGDLGARGKIQRVGTNRTGAAKLGSKGGLQVASAPLQQKGNQISIFCDDDASAAGQQQGAASEWKHLPSRTESHKENVQAAGQWAGQRLPQRNMPRMTFQEVGTFSKPAFDVHVDENAAQMTTPHKPVEMGCQALGERKVSKPSNALQHIKQDVGSDNTRVMYCKHLIYGGAREMSFEELRGIKDKTKRKEREFQAKMEAVRQREDKLLRQQEEQQEMMAKFQEELLQQRLQNQQLIDMLVKQKLEEASAPKPAHQAPSQPAQPQQTAHTLPPHPAPQAPVVPLQGPTAPVVPAQALHIHQPAPSQQMELGAPTHPPTQPQQQEMGNMEPEAAPCENVPMGGIDDHNVTKDRIRSISGDSTIGCTKHLVFDDLTGATGNFNIFCDTTENQAVKPPANPTHNSASTHRTAPAAPVPHNSPPITLSARIGQAEVDTITPNQSISLNASSANPDNKTPQTSCLSEKTPSSASFSSAPRSTRMGRLSNIRTPKGLTAPSPTINTREALGVISAMLNQSLENNQFGWDDPIQTKVTTQDKDFEMDFAVTEPSEKQPQKGLIFEDQSAFKRVGGFGGQGIVPMRQPLAVRAGIPRPQAEAPMPAPPSSSSSSSIGASISIFQDENEPRACAAGGENIHIFEDKPVEDTKENTPPSDYNQVREKREMMGILQASKGIPIMPLEDEIQDADNAVFSEAMEVQPAVDPLASSQHQDLANTMNVTIPTSVAGNHSFGGAARMASTPFNQESHRKLSFIPPMSTIKPREVPDAAPVEEPMIQQQENAPPPLLQKAVLQDSMVHLNRAKAVPAGLPSRSTQPVNESFEKTEYTVNQSGGILSPILETSAENARSSASSSASTTHSHASASSLETDRERVLPPAAPTNSGFSIHVDGNTDAPKSAFTEMPIGDAAHGFSIHLDNDEQDQSHRKTEVDSLAPSTAPTSGFQIHVDANQYQHPPAAASKPVENFEQMEAMSMSFHNVSLSSRAHNTDLDHSRMGQSRLDLALEMPLENGKEALDLLQKEDVPALEQSFIPDRQLHDMEDVEQELTTFGLKEDEPLDFSDPFNAGLQNLLLSQLPKPLNMNKGFYQDNQAMPDIKPGLAVNFGDEISVYDVTKKVGEGAFATIFLATCLDAQDMTDLGSDTRKVVLKVQRPPCPWEFYIVRELHARLSRLPSQVDVRPSLMTTECVYVYKDCSCLVTEYHANGTLLDLINLRKQQAGTNMDEEWVLHLTIEILQMVEFMHRCHIIHGDIKPDNFLISTCDSSDNVTCTQGSMNLLKLIDLGRSIDVSLFPQGTVFTSKCNTSGFNCTEMQSNLPWTYQVDYYGIAGTIHCMMFGKYMKVYKEGGIWKMNSKFPRNVRANWKHVFHTLLNVKSCDPADLPNLGDLRRELEKHTTMGKGEVKLDLELQLMDRPDQDRSL